MYGQWWTSVALLAALSLRHAIARSGTNTLEGYFHTRQLAFALGMLAVCAFLRNQNAIVLLLMACAAALHPTTTLWFVMWLAPRHSWPSRGGAAGSSGRWRQHCRSSPMAFSRGRSSDDLTRMDPEWIAAIGEKDYLFPLQWPPYAWAINLGYRPGHRTDLVAAASIGRASSHAKRHWSSASASLLVIFRVRAAVPVARWPSRSSSNRPACSGCWTSSRSSISRGCWRNTSRAARRWAAIAVAVTVAILATARGVYVMRVEFPDRPLVQARIPRR